MSVDGCQLFVGGDETHNVKDELQFFHDMWEYCLHIDEKCINMNKNEKEMRSAFNTSKRFARTNI